MSWILSFVSGDQATFLVLSAAPTWARIVASYFRTGLDIPGPYDLHQSFGWLPGASEIRQPGDVRQAVFEEALIAGTQVVETPVTLRCMEDAIFRTAPVTLGPDLTFPAKTGQLIQLGPAKGSLRPALEQCD